MSHIWLVLQYYDENKLSIYDITVDQIIGCYFSEKEALKYISECKKEIVCSFKIFFRLYMIKINDHIII
jgi:hypothetical protein